MRLARDTSSGRVSSFVSPMSFESGNNTAGNSGRVIMAALLGAPLKAAALRGPLAADNRILCLVVFIALRLSPKAHIVVKVKQVEPAQDVLARLAQLGEQAVEEFAPLQIIRPARILVSRPGCNLPGFRFGRGVGVNPFED